MNVDADEAESFGKQVYEEFKAENVTFMAAAITYQAFVSLIPLLVLLFFLLALVGDQALAQRVVQMTRSFLPTQAQQFLKQAIAGSSVSPSASIIGIVTLVWGAFRIFKGLDTAFSEIFDTEDDNSFVDKLKDSAVVFVALTLALVGAVVATWAFSALPIPFMGILSPVLLVVGLCIAFFPMYYLFPDLDLKPTDVLPGVVVGAVGWAALQALFQVYLALTGGAGGGVVGAVLLLLTWLYFSSLILLLGAVVNAVYLGHAGDHSGAGGGSSAGSSAGASGVRVTAGEGQNPDAHDRGEANAASAVDPDELREERKRLHRERDHLQRELRELRTERREREWESRTPDAEEEDDATELRRENRVLARRVRWYEKPAWERAFLRALGRDAPDTSNDADARHA